MSTKKIVVTELIPNLGPGRSVPVLSTLQLKGRGFLELAFEEAKALGPAGWTGARTAAFELRLAEFDTARQAQEAARGRLASAFRAVQLAAEAAHLWRRKLVAALLVLNRRGLAEVRPQLLRVGKQRRRPAESLDWMTNIRGAVESLRGPLETCFVQDPRNQLELVHSALLEAVAEVAVARAGVPVATHQVWKLAAAVNSDITELQLVARNAFAGRPELQRKFRRDRVARKLLLAGKVAPAAAPVVPVVPGPQVEPRSPAANDDQNAAPVNKVA